MARSHESAEGSLELLLDTITNTFGSVLFITMLVAILLRMSGHSTQDREPTSKIEQARAVARAAELSAEIGRLNATLETLPHGDPALARIEADIATSMQEIAAALTKDTSVATETIAKQERIADLEREASEIARDLEKLAPDANEQATRREAAERRAAELAALALELDRPVDPDRIEQTARLPELATTKKDQFSLLLKYGRLYVMHSWDNAGTRLGPNPDHFVIAARPDGRQSAKARPDAGHIADGATTTPVLREILKHFPPKEWVIAVVVNEDSFAQFQTVKESLVELGYQYEPVPVRTDGGVWDQGGSARGQ